MNKRVRHALRILAIVAVTVVYVFPVFWVMMTAFKERVDIFAMPPKLLFEPTLDNFVRVFQRTNAAGVGETTHFGRYFLNSVFLSFGSVFIALVIGTMGAYAVSRFHFKNRDFVMFSILSTRMLPAVAAIIPIYLLFRKLHLMNSYVGMTALYTAFNLPFVIWMMRSFFDEIPREIEEAAQVDGSSRFRSFYKVALPQVKSGIAATVVISLLFTWNEFLFALMLTGQETRTVPVALARTLQGELGVDWGVLAAIETLYVLPVLLIALLLQKYLLRGLTFGTVRR
ncbi:MAG: carbohydrate ABC transporter permease [Candidatus Poribacteria bacterium]|nr:carbohydrate ABC transporter permease [Candidatus Poribacteria bacterium]